MSDRRSGRWLAVILMIGVLASRTGLATQEVGTAPAFEVATIKPSDGQTPLTLQRAGNRLTVTNASIKWLIQWAFDLDDDRLIGVPKGADDARFDIVAKAPEESPAPGRMQLMMRALLADRFHLGIHHETRRLMTYALMKDGPLKLELTPATARPAANPFGMSTPGRLDGTQVTTAMLAKVLANQVGRPVDDATGLAGVFDFTLEWRPDSADVPVDGSRPSLFTALREQLGLRLEPRQTEVDVVVVDRVDLIPSDN
jgi:uncharacterized protein (TIGR03435 family)